MVNGDLESRVLTGNKNGVQTDSNNELVVQQPQVLCNNSSSEDIGSGVKIANISTFHYQNQLLDI